MKKRFWTLLVAVAVLMSAVAVPVHAEEPLYGEVNGDGKINNRDLGTLQQYLNDWQGVTVDLTAADVTHDGKVNNRDLGLLQQHLNEWEVSLAPALTLTDKTLYVGGVEQELTLAFAAGAEDVPLIAVDVAAALLSAHVQAKRDAAYGLEVLVQGHSITLRRDNGATAVLDFAEGTLYFENYNRFNRLSYELGDLDIMDSKGVDAQGRPAYFQRVLASEKAAKPSLVHLRERGIPFYMQGGMGYITLQTFSDLFLTPFEVVMAYNQDSVYQLDGNLLGDLQGAYYAPLEGVRSPQLIDLTYKQLCLVIDFHYGLQQSHGIDSADAYIRQIGLKEALCSEDPTEAFSALKTLVYKYFSDNHSNVLMHSPYNPAPNYGLGATEASVGYWEFYKNYQLYNSGRQMQYAGGLRPYSEVGDTAFVTFNTFTFATRDYYTHSPLEGDFADEVGLISYAHAQINRPNSPIKNVVIDLATNTGGHMDGGIYLAAWVLGNAIMHITDPVRDAEGTFIYRADVNLDRVFDARDTLSNVNVFLITSPITFSCANYVANAFKESGQVTILGTTTGGGASCVYMASLADGSAISFSSPLCMSGYKNGSYYDLDKGVAPDVKITAFGDFFDYNRIVSLIHKINE